jgi:hypothetical protein
VYLLRLCGTKTRSGYEEQAQRAVRLAVHGVMVCTYHTGKIVRKVLNFRSSVPKFSYTFQHLACCGAFTKILTFFSLGSMLLQRQWASFSTTSTPLASLDVAPTITVNSKMGTSTLGETDSIGLAAIDILHAMRIDQ